MSHTTTGALSVPLQVAAFDQIDKLAKGFVPSSNRPDSLSFLV